MIFDGHYIEIGYTCFTEMDDLDWGWKCKLQDPSDNILVAAVIFLLLVSGDLVKLVIDSNLLLKHRFECW
jgi:hypothetical protein